MAGARNGWIILLLLGGCDARSTGSMNPTACNDPIYECVAPLMEARCTWCHSSDLASVERSAAPVGVDFDTEQDLARFEDRILARAVVEGTMPPGAPLSGDERRLLEAYLATVTGTQCAPSCAGKTCGEDGCGGACGSCGQTERCTASGRCECVPDCTGAQCGDDGCGGSCGSCSGGLTCVGGVCECVPDCSGRACGGDGCGGSCGTCRGMQVCNTISGQCGASCTPDDCTTRVCGDDGCGGSCGTCGAGAACESGQCVWPDTSFAADVMPLFSGCGTNNCHGGARPQTDLDLSSAGAAWEDLVNVPSTQCGTRVVPGNAGTSYLVSKLTGVGMCSGSVMPKGDPPLTPAQIDVVRAWIGAGAAND